MQKALTSSQKTWALALLHVALGTSQRTEEKKPRSWNHVSGLPSSPSSPAWGQFISSVSPT